MMNKRKGFTLVELLIVIVVIGILSAMMMLSSNEAVTSAKASDIVSNMRNLKTAALSYWADNMDDVRDSTYSAGVVVDTATKIGGTGSTSPATTIVKYLNNENDSSLIAKTTEGSTTSEAAYSVVSGASGYEDEWYVKYTFGDLGDSEKERVKVKLAGRAKSVGLLSASSSAEGTTEFKATGNEVYMRVR